MDIQCSKGIKKAQPMKITVRKRTFNVRIWRTSDSSCRHVAAGESLLRLGERSEAANALN